MAKRLSSFLSDETLCSIADDYLKSVAEGSELEIRPPIPIEEILDVYLGVDIVPQPGLRDKYMVEATISTDQREIRVDADIHRHPNSNRYRFTLAHELAHILLHRRICQEAGYTDVASWIDFKLKMDQQDLEWIERQAFTLAGFLMVPRKELAGKYEEMMGTLQEHGVTNLTPQMMQTIAKQIGDYFKVSWQVIRSRGSKDGLWEWSQFPPN